MFYFCSEPMFFATVALTQERYNAMWLSYQAGGDAAPVAKYFLAKAMEYGDLITNLKMQKLVYYAYAAALVCLNEHLFESRIEAWSNGPVVPLLYGELKQFGGSPINASFLGDQDIEDLKEAFTEEQLQLLDKVFARYGSLSAFELVVLTHSEDPWLEARKGLQSHQSSNAVISDDVIRSTYTEDDFEVDESWLAV
jgi:uncharacterized phage-associated protein